GERGQELAGPLDARVASIDARQRRPRGAFGKAAEAIALARDAGGVRLRIGAQPGGQTGADREIAFAASFAADLHAAPKPAREREHALVVARNARPQGL